MKESIDFQASWREKKTRQIFTARMAAGECRCHFSSWTLVSSQSISPSSRKYITLSLLGIYTACSLFWQEIALAFLKDALSICITAFCTALVPKISISREKNLTDILNDLFTKIHIATMLKKSNAQQQEITYFLFFFFTWTYS